MEIRFQHPETQQLMDSFVVTETTPKEGTFKDESGLEVEYSLSDALKNEKVWDECPLCHAYDAYLQKDVPKKLFFWSLVPCLALAFYFLFFNWFVGMTILGLLAFFDFILFRTLKSVLVCYRCGTQARGFATQKDFAPFDHHVAERYKKRA